MADDPSAAGDPEAGRSDLYARIQDLQDDIDSGLSAAQVQDAVRGAVAALLPGLVSDAVSSAVAGALPSVAHDVAVQITDRQTVVDADGVEARLAALEDALDGVGDRLEALTRDQTAATVASFDDLRAQIAGIRDPTALAAPYDAGRQEIDALREDLADALDYVRTTLAAELTARAAETQSAVRALSGSLATRPADGEELEALHVRFDSLLAAVDTAAEAARDRQVAESERLRAALADQLAAAATATATAEALTEQVAALGAAMTASTADSAPSVAGDLDGLRAEVVEGLQLLRELLDARVSGVTAGVFEQILDVRTDLATAAGETLSTLADVDGRVDEMHGRLADLDDRIEALRSDLVAAVDGGQDRLADRLAAAHDDLRSGLADEAAARRVAVDSVRESQDATIARLEQIAGHPLLSGAVDLGRELGELRVLMADVTGAQEQAAAAARDEAARADEAAAARTQEMHDRVEVLQTQLRAAVDGLPPQVAAWRAEAAEDRDRLAAALTGLERAREEMAQLVAGIGDQGTTAAATLRDASLAALEQLRSDSDVAADLLRRSGEEARAALDEHARASRVDVLDDVRTAAARALDDLRTAASSALDDVRTAITAQTQATSAATSEIEQVAHRVQSAGRLVVAYLSERDAALEEVRDRDTVQLLEDVLSTLSRKERDRVASETRGLLARRRESRQAERWRQHRENTDNPDMDVDDEALLELLDAPRPRPHPGPAPAAPEASTDADAPIRAASEPAPAKKAPTKKAPAKKAPAKKAPAKKAPAKKAPAKKAPAKKAAATGGSETPAT